MSLKTVTLPPDDDEPEVDQDETEEIFDVTKDFRELYEAALSEMNEGNTEPAAGLFAIMRKNRIALNILAKDLKIYIPMAAYATMMPGKGTVSGKALDDIFGKTKDSMSREELAADETVAYQWFLDRNRCKAVLHEKFLEVAVAVKDIGTHSAKFPTASADGTTAIFGARDVLVAKSTPYASSMTILKSQRLLSSGNAAQMHYARFLCHEMTVDGVTSTIAADLANKAGIYKIVSHHFNDTSFIEQLSADLSSRMKGVDVVRVSGENKTLFWPVGGGAYHMITPLASSTMLLDFNRRIWGIRQSPNNVITKTLKHGGSSPQNLGSLGGDLSGKLIHLSASIPSLNARGIEAIYLRLRRGGSYLTYMGKDDLTRFVKALAAHKDDTGNEIALNERRRTKFHDVSIAIVERMLADVILVAMALSNGYISWNLDGLDFSKISERVKRLLDPDRRTDGLVAIDRDALIADIVTALRESSHDILLTGPMLDRFEKAAAIAIKAII